MIVAIDATAIGSGLGGDETLVAGLLRGLCCVKPHDLRLILLAGQDAALPPDVVNTPGVSIERAPRRPGPVHFAASLPRWLKSLQRRGLRPDVVVTNTHAPLWSPAPVLLMVPDLSFLHLPEAYPRGTRIRLQVLVKRQVRTAAAVLTISEFSRDDLQRAYGVDPQRLHVIPLVADPAAEPTPAARERLARRGVTSPYLLYLGNLHQRKNVPRLIRAFHRVIATQPTLSDVRLIIAGGQWFGADGEVTPETQAAAEGAALGLADRVQFLGRVDDDEREVLLRDALGLAYLSIFEGFGLPPIEAMLRGTAVLASSTTATGETCGSAALLTDPVDDQEIDERLSQFLTDASLRAGLTEKGYARAAEFTLERTGAALLAALERHCAAAAPAPPRMIT